jgi:hypothetical protein
MIPVIQTKVVVKNKEGEMVVRGNCYAACIASIMELPITEVPNVEVLFHIDGSYWAEVMHTFLTSRGWELYTNSLFQRFHPESGFSFDGTDENGKIPEYYECKDKYYMVSGMSTRGVMHMCIFQNGILVHDPHPSKDGLMTHEVFEELIKS